MNSSTLITTVTAIESGSVLKSYPQGAYTPRIILCAWGMNDRSFPRIRVNHPYSSFVPVIDYQQGLLTLKKIICSFLLPYQKVNFLFITTTRVYIQVIQSLKMHMMRKESVNNVVNAEQDHIFLVLADRLLASGCVCFKELKLKAENIKVSF